MTANLVPAPQRVRGRLITREPMTLCGTDWVEETFRQLDPQISLHWQVEEGGQAKLIRPCSYWKVWPAHPHR
ncbi:MAG: hypothetical protein WDM77_13550 [Steroidobacteraceae bacterium]